MKQKIITLCLLLAIVFSTSGCLKKAELTNVDREANNTHKIIVVVVDKETKAPIKDARVYILGHSDTYTTDNMGKTPELDVELNKEYFAKYTDEMAGRMRSGFVNVGINAKGYSKHLETDYSVYPGDSISIVRVELTKGKSYTANSNSPDISYIGNLIKAYEKFESIEIKSENTIKYKVSVLDDKNKPIEGARVVIPEANGVNITDNKGNCEFNIPYIEANNITYPVNKGYGEITVLIYKEGYLSKAILRAQTRTNDKSNSIGIKIKKSNKPGVECEVVKPAEEWVKGVLDSIKE